MKKAYISPELYIVEVNNTILAGSYGANGLPVNPDITEGTDGWGTGQSFRDLWDDEDEI